VLVPQTDEDGQSVLGVPITLRGEVIGTLGVKRPPGHEWSEDEIALVQAVGERVALIAEDIRLLDEADRTAQREQTVSAVADRLQRATEMDTLLRVALSELSGALGSDNIALRIGSPPGKAEDGQSEDGTDG
jgi:GAF domain-containing protein